MAINKIVFPVDLTGEATSNRVVGEVHALGVDRYRAVVLNSGPFYADSVVIVDKLKNRRLHRGRDYECLYYYEDISKLTKAAKEVDGVILIVNPDVSTDITIDYNFVGGPWTSNVITIAKAIEDLDLDNRNTYWSQILEKPDTFLPAPHLHDVGDYFGFEYIISILIAMRDTISIGDGQTTELIKEYVDRAITVLTNALNLHVARRDNPHGVTAHQAGTLTREEINALFKTVHDALDAFEPRFSSILKSIKAITDRLAAIDAVLEDQSDRIGNVERRMTRIDGLIAALNERIEDFVNEISRIDGELDIIRKKNVEQDKVMAATNKVVTEHTAKLVEHANQLSAHASHLTQLDNKTNATNSAVAAQLVRIEANAKGITDLWTALNLLKSRVDTVESTNNSQQASINDLLNKHNSQQGSIDSISNRVTALERKSASLHHAAGGGSISGLHAGAVYLVSVYGITADRGTKGAWLNPVVVKNSGGGVLASTSGANINWMDGNTPQSASLIVTAPANGVIYGYTDYGGAQNMTAIKIS